MSASPQRFIDLHIHSNFSDGAFSPEDLLQQAKAADLSAIAIADHDSVGGVSVAMPAGAALGIEVIPAVELSVQFKQWQDVHLLGYGIDVSDELFLEKLNHFRERRERRNELILERINTLLQDEGRESIGINEVLTHSRDAIGRPHIARALLGRGYVGSVEEAFRSYLTPCNVPKAYWPIDDAIREIRRIGGVAVLAHPTSVSTNRQELRDIILELQSMGLDGIEAFNNMAHSDDMEFLRRLAIELGLLATGGSDYHGIEDGLQIGKGRGGIRFSATLLAPLQARLSERNSQFLSL